MADIDIEKKNKNNKSVWLWIIGILIVAGIVWWIAAANDEPEVEEATVIEQRISSNMEPALLYNNFIDNKRNAEKELLSFA